ncbi:hypothetical protein CU669_16825 [Paramagnetospirillum kuznetsovii]|uniref:Calcineurin-like phosphoesterase domain-containing protein n=1 Tax=Paramagnetospirillum kuznetsovii TaxID=2053833 RepID=A0A364NV20_9PROT|nr:metallophosphoesterase [Paramagnetospirillum kuznetsovii]RAU20747.1 hypothetical protein CU669_16825 [Paramagnetospirillum kuznetsovii]
MDRIYAIGDVHGCAEQLDALLRQIHLHAAGAGIDRPKVVCLGDYIDRGPDSKGVLDILTGPKMDQFEPVFLLGNHDLVLVGVCEGGLPSWDWVSEHGGQKCMDSFGHFPARNFKLSIKHFRQAIPPAHKAFLAALKASVSHRYGPWFFSHAGVNPNRALDQQTAMPMIYGDIDMFQHDHDALAPNLRERLGACVVHGHFVSRSKQVDVHPHRICVDTGAGYPGGKLSAVALFNDGRVEVLT